MQAGAFADAASFGQTFVRKILNSVFNDELFGFGKQLVAYGSVRIYREKSSRHGLRMYSWGILSTWHQVPQLSILLLITENSSSFDGKRDLPGQISLQS